MSRKLFIGTPARPRAVSVGHHLSMCNTIMLLRDNLIPSHVFVSGDSTLVGHQRAIITAYFMVSNCSHLLMIDADVAWPPEAVLRLLEHGQEFTAVDGPHRVHERPWVEMLSEWRPAQEPDLLETNRLPGMFWLLQRSVIEKMIAAYPHLKWTREHPLKPGPASDFLYALFDQTIINGGFQSEDFSFCYKWKAIGGRIFVDPSIPLGHQVEKEITCRMADWLPPETAS